MSSRRNCRFGGKDRGSTGRSNHHVSAEQRAIRLAFGDRAQILRVRGAFQLRTDCAPSWLRVDATIEVPTTIQRIGLRAIVIARTKNLGRAIEAFLTTHDRLTCRAQPHPAELLWGAHAS